MQSILHLKKLYNVYFVYISILVKTKIVRRRVSRRPPPKPAGPIIIENPVDYQLALQQKNQQIILGQKLSNEVLSNNSNDIASDAQFASDEDAKNLAEFLKPKSSTERLEFPSNLESGNKTVDVNSASESKDNKVLRI